MVKKQKKISPNNTLYINNLNEKISIPDLKNELFTLFSKYGKIFEIRLSKSIKLKGQAFITFEKINDSKKAISNLNGQEIFGKKLNVNFAKQTSENFLVSIGKLKENKKKENDIERKKKRDEFYKKIKEDAINEKNKMIEKYYNEINNNNSNNNSEINNNNNENNNNNDDENLNNILFVEFKNISDDINEEVLKKLFSECKGFININMFKNKAFIEFDNIVNAQYARIKLNKTRINNNILNITFAKK
jgi:RNA recognition motif-containing protein